MADLLSNHIILYNYFANSILHMGPSKTKWLSYYDEMRPILIVQLVIISLIISISTFIMFYFDAIPVIKWTFLIAGLVVVLSCILVIVFNRFRAESEWTSASIEIAKIMNKNNDYFEDFDLLTSGEQKSRLVDWNTGIKLLITQNRTNRV